MNTFGSPRDQTGMTLVELLVSVLIGSILTLALARVYVAVARNYAQDEAYALMQENGRYALRLLSEDLVMTDFWGELLSPDTVSTTLSTSAGDCADSIDALDAESSLLFNNYHLSPANTQFTPCADLLADQVAGTDILVVKRVSGTADASTYIDVLDVDGDGDTSETRSDGAGTDEVVYLRTNGTAGALIDDSTSTNLPATGESDWAYKTSVYFIRDHFATDGDGSPSLCRMSLDGTALGDPECVAEGVEDLHLQFGIDDDDDGAVNFYSADLNADDMPSVVTARVHLLVRSATPVANYTNSRTYNLGDVTVAAANDGNYRRVFTTTVSLWNTVSLRQFN